MHEFRRGEQKCIPLLRRISLIERLSRGRRQARRDAVVVQRVGQLWEGRAIDGVAPSIALAHVVGLFRLVMRDILLVVPNVPVVGRQLALVLGDFVVLDLALLDCCALLARQRRVTDLVRLLGG